MRQLQAASAVGQAQLQRPGSGPSAGSALQAAQILLSPADFADRADLRQRSQHVRRAVPARRRPGRERERRHRHGRDHVRRNDALAAQVAVLTHARLLVLLTEVDGCTRARPARPAPSCSTTARSGGRASRPRDRSRPRWHGQQDRGRASSRPARGIPTVIASGRAEAVLVPIVAGEQRGTRFAAGRLRTVGVQALDPVREAGRAARSRWMRARERALSTPARACSPSASRPATVRSAPETRSSSSSATGAPIGKGIASVAAAEFGSRARGLEVVHRDRLVLY